MNLFVALVDERDNPGRLVGKRERVPAGPWTGRFRAVLLGSQHRVAAVQRIGQAEPLAGTAARAVERYHQPAAPERGGASDIGVHRIGDSGCAVYGASGH